MKLVGKNISKRWQIGFDAAEAAAELSNGKLPGEKLGAALFAGSKLLSLGANIWGKTHPDTSNPAFDRNIHAEQVALVRRKHFDDNPNKLILYVYRAKRIRRRELIPACSRPCKICLGLIKAAQIKRVRFIDENGEATEIKP